MTENKTDKMPALYEHLHTVYEAMMLRSKLEKDQGTGSSTNRVVYEGFLTRHIYELGFSTPMYTHITRLMQDMGCIKQIKRGGGGTPTIWLMREAPTAEKFNEHYTSPTKGGGTVGRPPKQGTTASPQQLLDNKLLAELKVKVEDLELTVGKLMDAIAQQGKKQVVFRQDYETTVAAIKSQLAGMGQELSIEGLTEEKDGTANGGLSIEL